MQVWNLLHAARWKRRTQKSRQKSPSGHHRTALSGYMSSQLRHVSTIGKKSLSSNMSSTCPHNMVNFGLLAAETVDQFGIPCKFQLVSRLGSVTALHLVVGVSQTLRRWTEGATYIRQGDHHVGHWTTFLVFDKITKIRTYIKQGTHFARAVHSHHPLPGRSLLQRTRYNALSMGSKPPKLPIPLGILSPCRRRTEPRP